MDAIRRPHIIFRTIVRVVGSIIGFYIGFAIAALPCYVDSSGYYCSPHLGGVIIVGTALGIFIAFYLGRYSVVLLSIIHNRNKNIAAGGSHDNET